MCHASLDMKDGVSRAAERAIQRIMAQEIEASKQKSNPSKVQQADMETIQF
jgi:hypothetical protein